MTQLADASEDSERAAAAAEPEFIVLVHGTGATDGARVPRQWWKPDSDFSQKLLTRLGGNYQIWGNDPRHKGFNWCPGPNLESERRLAGRRLLELLQSFEVEQRTYHLVGHSHGGSVIWHALRLAAFKNAKLAGLKSWTTVGTPFLEFRPSSACLWEATALLLCAVTIGLTIGSFGFSSADLPIIWHELSGVGFFVTLILTTSVGVVVVVLISMVLNWTIRFLAGRRERFFDLRARRLFQDRWYAIWHSDDEPIVGLRASISSAPQLTPRIAAKNTLPLKRLLFAPYDLFLARSGDQYAWRVLMRRLQGANLRSMDLIDANVAPAVLQPWPSLSTSIEVDIRTAALRNWPQVLVYLRAKLNAISDSGNGAMLLDALPQDLWSCVIHNSYFDNEDVVELMAAHLVACQTRPITKRVKAPRPPFAAGTWLTVWTMGVVATTALFSVAIASLTAPLSRNYQITEIVSRLKRPETLAIQSSPEVGALLVRLDAMYELEDPAKALALIIDPTTASLAAQQLAYSYAFAGKFSDQTFAILSDHLGEETGMDGRTGKAAVLVQAAIGATKAKRPTDSILKLLTGIFHDDVRFDNDFFDSAVNSLVEIGQDETAKDLLASQTDAKGWCEQQAYRGVDSGNKGDKELGKKVVALCRAVFPSADLDPHYLAAPVESPQTPVVASSTTSDAVAELVQLVRSHQVQAAKERLKRVLADTGATMFNPWLDNDRTAFFTADAAALMGLMSAFRDEKDMEAIYGILRYLFWRVSNASLASDDRIDQIVTLAKKLIEAGFSQEMNRFAVARQKALVVKTGTPNQFVDQDSFWDFGTAAAVFYALGDLYAVRNNLQQASEQLAKSSGDTSYYQTATQLGSYFRRLDYRTAHKFFELARSVIGKNPIGNSRSVLYGQLAHHFAELGDYKTARETAERAGSLVADTGPDSAKYGGMLGGYAAILDTEIARRLSAHAKELGMEPDNPNLYLNYTYRGSNS